MKAHQINGWLEGVKLRKDTWDDDKYILFTGTHWVDQDKKRLGFYDIVEGFCTLEELFSDEDWLPVDESKLLEAS